MKNHSIKKIIPASILLIGVVLAWFIVREKKPGETFFDVAFGSKESRSVSFTRGEGNDKNNTQSQNLTEAAVEKYLMELAKKNPDGPKGNTLVFPAQNILESTLESAANVKISFVAVTENDIKISKETGSVAERAYLEAVQNADKKNSKKINTNEMSVINSFFSENNSAPLMAFTEGLQSLISDLIAVPVPPSMKDFHIQLINFQTKKISILKSFLELSNDPVRTIVALKEYEQLPIEERVLSTIIAQKFK